MGASQSKIPRGGVTTRTPPSHTGLVDVEMQPLTELRGHEDPARSQLTQELLAEVTKRHRVGLGRGSHDPCSGTHRYTGSNTANRPPVGRVADSSGRRGTF